MCSMCGTLRRRPDTTSLSSLWAFAAAKLLNRCHLPEESGIGFGLFGAMPHWLEPYCLLQAGHLMVSPGALAFGVAAKWLGWIVDWFRTNGIMTFQSSRVWLKPRKRMNRYEKEVTYHKRRARSEFRNVGTCFQFETTRKLTRVILSLSDPQAPVALWVLSSTLGYQSLLNRLSSHRSLAEEHEEPPIEILIVSLNIFKLFSCLMLFHYLYIYMFYMCNDILWYSVMIFMD